MISIWYRREEAEPERIDQVSGAKQASYLAGEYAIAFATLPGQHRYGKDKVWAGRRADEPGKENDR